MQILQYFIPVAPAVSLPDFSKINDLPGFISSIYSFAITVVGIAVFIRILYAGFLMLTAAGNASKWGDARGKMQNAVIGAILLFAAYLILYIINPDLVKNAFDFSIPGQSVAPAAQTLKTNATAGQGAISGRATAGGGGATSFHGLPIAKAQEGIYAFTIKVTDRNGDTCRENYSMEVVSQTAVSAGTDFYAKHSVAGKYSASILNAANAQGETPTPVRYVKIESTSNSWIAWREIEIYDENNQKIKPVNAAVSSQWCTPEIRKAVPALCPDSCCDPANLYDGNPNTLWNGGGINADGSPRGCQTYYPNSRVCWIWAPLTAWVQLDLGGAKRISKVRLLTENSPNPVQATHKLLISSSGTSFSLVHEFSGNISSNTWLGYQGPFVAEGEAGERAAGESAREVTETLQEGGCVITTRTVPDAVEGVPYYAEIYAAGQPPFVYEIADGSLPGGLNLVAALDMPVLTMKNITAQRTPPTAFKVGDSFKLELTNGKPNSDVYIKWFKNGVQWFYPGVNHDASGWSKYAKTDADGNWVNQAAYTSEFVGAWQIQAMVDGKVSKFVEVQVLAPEVKIVVNPPGPTAGGQAAVPSYTSSPTCTVTTFCEDTSTGERSSVNPNPTYTSGKGWNNCEEGARMISECAYSGESRASCEQYDFEARNCMDRIHSLQGEGNVISLEDMQNLPHSADGNPPTNVQAGSLYTTNQYVGDIYLGSNNQLVRCRYSDQIAAVHCGEISSGEYCLPDGRNAGWNEHWCAGQTGAGGKLINPTPAPTPIPRGGTGGGVGPGTGGRGR